MQDVQLPPGAQIVAEPIAPTSPFAPGIENGAPPAQARADFALGSPPPRFPQIILNIGFIAGLLFAAACLAIAGWYLVSYLSYGTTALDRAGGGSLGMSTVLPHMYLARVLLQSCGLAVGMAFGFLGFSLFLIGVGGNMNASAAGPGGVAIQVARISPGAFVMLCSAVLVGLCATGDPQASMGGSEEGASTQNGAAAEYNVASVNSATDSSANLAAIPPDPSSSGGGEGN